MAETKRAPLQQGSNEHQSGDCCSTQGYHNGTFTAVLGDVDATKDEAERGAKYSVILAALACLAAETTEAARQSRELYRDAMQEVRHLSDLAEGDRLLQKLWQFWGTLRAANPRLSWLFHEGEENGLDLGRVVSRREVVA